MTQESRKSKPIRGDNFLMKDPLFEAFSKEHVEKFCAEIEATLRDNKKEFTGLQLDVEFDEHGLVKGYTNPDSLISLIGLRERSDLETFMARISEGRNFDALMTYDAGTKRAVIAFMLKKHTSVDKMMDVSDIGAK